MAEGNKGKNEYNIFIERSIYPEAASVFTFQLKSLEEVKDNCYVVLDTNVLLAPYALKEDLGYIDVLAQCRKTYKYLIEKKRLIIPGQVAREFAKNRMVKLTELHQQLSLKKQIQAIPKRKYPLLQTHVEYQDVERLEKEINGKIADYQKAVSKVLIDIRDWQLNDPVRQFYGEMFEEDTIYDPSFDEEDTKKDLERRIVHHISPGYKDGSKDDNGIGDLLIWYTILELARTKKQSVIFVSLDKKPDWFKQSENVPLCLRYELVDEFRRVSEGQSLHVINFSSFLKLYGANEKIVKDIKQEEENLIVYNIAKTRANWEDEILQLCESFFSLWRDFVIQPRKEDITTLQEIALKVGEEVFHIARINATSYSFKHITKANEYVAIRLIELGNMKMHTDEDEFLAKFLKEGTSIQNEVRHLAMSMNSRSK